MQMKDLKSGSKYKQKILKNPGRNTTHFSGFSNTGHQDKGPHPLCYCNRPGSGGQVYLAVVAGCLSFPC